MNPIHISHQILIPNLDFCVSESLKMLFKYVGVVCYDETQYNSSQESSKHAACSEQKLHDTLNFQVNETCVM